MRAERDIKRYPRGGRPVQVRPPYRTPGADGHGVYPRRSRYQRSTRVRAFVDFLAHASGQAGRAAG